MGESEFFPLKVLVCHVLFKLPSAGTRLSLGSDSSPSSLLYPTSQPFIHHPFIYPSILPPPPIHSSMEDKGGAEGTKLER